MSEQMALVSSGQIAKRAVRDTNITALKSKLTEAAHENEPRLAARLLSLVHEHKHPSE